MRVEHGTRTRYGKGCRCLSCRVANRTYMRSLRAKHLAAGLAAGDSRHGTPGGYTHYGCRCTDCTAANTAACRRSRTAVAS